MVQFSLLIFLVATGGQTRPEARLVGRFSSMQNCQAAGQQALYTNLEENQVPSWRRANPPNSYYLCVQANDGQTPPPNG
jgi:hypothetical protein